MNDHRETAEQLGHASAEETTAVYGTDAPPAVELRTAAEKLRGTCAAAAPGPWTIAKVPPYTDPLLMSRYEETPDDEDVLIVGTVDLEPEDQAIVQLLHPGVGLALADWLDQAAHHYECGIRAADDVFRDDPAGREAFLTTGPGAPSPHALAVARAINGGTQ
ncbi:hypothetical protein ACWEQ7_22150 [Streptomyces sp. NPDC004069]